MTKSIEALFKANIRPITPADFDFIRNLAAKFPNFTVPSEFLLWFFSQYHPDYCRILEQEEEGPKAYLLAMPTTAPENGIAIWQVAASPPIQPFSLEYFAAYLREVIDRTGASSLSFSASEEAGTLRLIRSLANRFSDCRVSRIGPVPVAQGECEFRISPIR